MSLSKAARRAGRMTRMRRAEKRVPSLIVIQILAAIAEARVPTIAVTRMRTEAEQRMVWMEPL